MSKITASQKLILFLSIVVIGLLFAKNFSPLNLLAACDPATGDYTDCYVDDNPEYNIDQYTYTLVDNDNRQVYPFEHDTDPGAPQLLTLTPDWNGTTPTVTSVANLNPTENDHPASWADHEGTGATYVGFNITPGAEVNVPWADYDIGGGYNAIVLHADENGITLKFTAEDDIVSGYTVYLENFNVDQSIVDMYHQAIETGRTFMLALDAGQRIGTARDELFVAIRDTGAFKDPRWLEWWLLNPDLNPLPPELLAILNMPPTIITPTPPPLTCQNPAAKPGVYRPAACKDCGGEVKEPIKACAETFVMEQDTWFYIHEGNGPHGWDEDASELKYCPDDRDDQQNVAYFERTWGGVAELDITSTTVPFVGYYNFPPLNQESKYLARYFTGSLVGKGPQNPVGSEEFNKEAKAQAGVMSKLFSPEYQDVLRCKMIETALIDPNENYQIPFKDNPHLPKPKKLAEFKGRFKNTPCTEPKYPDPGASETKRMAYQLEMEAWLAEYEVWLGSDWAKLWPYIPLTTLKDAPGTLTLQVQRTPGQLSITNYQLSFPHLATIYQATQELNKHLMPEFAQQGLVASETTNPGVIVAAPNGKEIDQELAQSSSYCGYKLALGETVQLAQANTTAEPETNDEPQYAYQVGVENIRYNSATNTIDYGIRIEGLTGPAQAGMHIWFAANGGNLDDSGGTPGYYDSTDPNHASRLLPAQVDENGNFTITVTVFNPHIHTDDQVIRETNYQCQGKVDLATGEITSTSCSSIGAPTSTPTNLCKNPDRYTPPTCKMDAITDINPNDPICASPYPIETVMTATDYRATLSQKQLTKLLSDLNKCIDKCRDKYPRADQQDERERCKEECRWRKYGDYNPLILYRKMGIDTQIPVLGKIRDYTIGDSYSGGNQRGVFDIFRPADMDSYPDDNAKSTVGYSYQGKISNSSIASDKEQKLMNESSQANPGKGDFYFPYLGGIEKAKQCVSKGILNPNSQESQIISQQYCP